MIGPKKLSDINREIADAVLKDGGKAIQWLNAAVASRKRKNGQSQSEDDVLQSLQRILSQNQPPAKRQKRA